MTDFFADLERQLVDAARERRVRLRRARRRRAAALSATLLALLATGGGLAAAVTGGDGDHRAGRPAAGTPATPGHGLAVDPADGSMPALDAFTTAVLNGTTTPGLGRGVANRLANAGAKIGTVTNAASQDVAETQVFYASPRCRMAAARVARALDLRATDLTMRPLPEGLRVIAGRAAVVVLVGGDQDRAPAP